MGSPPLSRQVREVTASGVVYRDGRNEHLLIELDGLAFHSSARARAADLERDLDAAATGENTRRLGWSQVMDRPCSTADKLARVFALAGWAGTPYPCDPSCAVGSHQSGDSQSPDDWESPA